VVSILNQLMMLNAAVILLTLFNCATGEMDVANALLPTSVSHSSSITNASMLMQKIIADPNVFISELASTNPTTIRNVVAILEGLLLTGTTSKTKFETDLSDAESARSSKQLTKNALTIEVENLSSTLATKTEEKRVAGLEVQTAEERKALMKAEVDANIPMLTTEITALTSVISLLRDLIHEDSSEILNVPDSSRSYSSKAGEWMECGSSMLDSGGAWCAGSSKAGEWMQMDLGSARTVLGVVESGRAGSSQWVTSFTVQTSIDGVTFTSETEPFSSGSAQADYNLVNAAEARYVRIVVYSYHGHSSMRAAVRVKSE